MKVPNICPYCGHVVVLTSNSELYSILAAKLDIDVKDCHFGYFETDRLLQSIRLMSNTNWWKDGD